MRFCACFKRLHLWICMSAAVSSFYGFLFDSLSFENVCNINHGTFTFSEFSGKVTNFHRKYLLLRRLAKTSCVKVENQVLGVSIVVGVRPHHQIPRGVLKKLQTACGIKFSGYNSKNPSQQPQV